MGRGVKTISNFRMEFWHPPKSVLLGIPINRINLILFSKYETPPYERFENSRFRSVLLQFSISSRTQATDSSCNKYT